MYIVGLKNYEGVWFNSATTEQNALVLGEYHEKSHKI